MTKLSDHYSKVASVGCIVCRKMGMGFTPAELHHPWGKKGENEFRVIPLCYPHHRSGVKTDLFVSRHPYKREWVKRYGTELELYCEANRLI